MAMITKKTVKTARRLTSIVFGIGTFVIFDIISEQIPEYFSDCGWLTIGARVLWLGAFLMAFVSILDVFLSETAENECFFAGIIFPAIYEVICLVYFVRIRVFGYHGLYAFHDSMTTIVIVLAIWSALWLIIWTFKTTRRILIGNTWCGEPMEDDTHKYISYPHLAIMIISICIALTVDLTNKYMFAPSGEINGCDYVNLGLPSGNKWATTNLYADKVSEKGLDIDSDDSVQVIMGSDWTVPTTMEWKELLDNCKRLRSCYDGIYGITLIGRNRAKRLFIPVLNDCISEDINYLIKDNCSSKKESIVLQFSAYRGDIRRVNIRTIHGDYLISAYARPIYRDCN